MPRKTSNQTKTSAKKYSAVPTKAKKPATKAEATPIYKSVSTPVAEAAAIVEMNAPTAITALMPAAAEAVATAESTAAPTVVAPIVEAPEVATAAMESTLPTSNSNEQEVIAGLIEALNSSDADIARDAATSLGSLRNSAAVEPLINVLNNTDEYFHGVVRAAAAASLGQLRDLRAVDALMIAVCDPQAEPSAEAIRSLATLGDARAIGALIEVVRNSSGFFLPIARRAAVLALARFNNADAIAELRAVSCDLSEDAVIRDAAAEALQRDDNAAD